MLTLVHIEYAGEGLDPVSKGVKDHQTVGNLGHRYMEDRLDAGGSLLARGSGSTLPQANTEPGTEPFKEDKSLSRAPFSGSMLVFQSVVRAYSSFGGPIS